MHTPSTAPHEEEENLHRATRIAEKIFTMDSFSAQLRLIYAARLRDGEFDAGAIKIMHTHLREVWFLAETMMREVEFLIPTITNEPATAQEKEPQQ